MKGTAVQRPFEGSDQGAPGGQGVGWNRRRKMEEGKGGVSGGEKLRKVSRHIHKAKCRDRKQVAWGWKRREDWGVMPRGMQFLYETMENGLISIEMVTAQL